MAAKAQTVKMKRKIEASASEVYRALTRAAVLRQWFCDAAQAEARKGGRLYVAWNTGYHALGEFTQLEPNKEVAFTWQGTGEPKATRVKIRLQGRKDSTEVSVTHGGMGSGDKWLQAREAFEKGWETGLENLQSVLETGEDLRYVRRPMLGVHVGTLDDHEAEKLGVPVRQGIRLDGVVDGMGAQTAGLQGNDVIVGIDGKEVLDWASLTNALQGCRAGEVVPVDFYRGAEKRRVMMTLSRRPLPERPETAAAFADRLRALYAASDADLAQAFEGVSEAEADYKPGPKDWSAKEVLTHIIASERSGHDWIAELITDSERWFDDYDNELVARPSGALTLHPSLAALLAELKRAQAETVAIIGALPEDFIARKRGYWRLYTNSLQPPTHAQTHIAQIRETVAAARRQ